MLGLDGPSYANMSGKRNRDSAGPALLQGQFCYCLRLYGAEASRMLLAGLRTAFHTNWPVITRPAPDLLVAANSPAQRISSHTQLGSNRAEYAYRWRANSSGEMQQAAVRGYQTGALLYQRRRGADAETRRQVFRSNRRNAYPTGYKNLTFVSQQQYLKAAANKPVRDDPQTGQRIGAQGATGT